MMCKRIYIILLLVIVVDISLVDCGVTIWQRPNNIDDPPAKEGTSGGRSSHIQTIIPTGTESVNITTEILGPNRDNGFFNDSSEVISILTKVTPLSKGGLKNLEIWQIPLTGLKIENCTYPIRTSKIVDLLEYRDSDKSTIKYKDVTNIRYLREQLKTNNQDPLYLRIYSLLNNNTKYLLKQNKSDQDAELHSEIVKDFNYIINNPSDQDINTSYFIGSKTILRLNNRYQGFNNNSRSFLAMNDYKLFKRRLLEDAFPESIKPVKFDKDHEDYNLGKSNMIVIGKNEIGSSDLKSGESIIVKYYLRPEKLGTSGIRSIIRANNLYYEYIKSINVIEREPRFEINYICPSKELVKNEPTEFEYHIKYVGGDDNEKVFNISFNPVVNEGSGTVFCIVEPRKMNRTFSIGKTESFRENVTYLKEGYQLSPPTITIEGKEERFESDICVFKEDDQSARFHYERLALDAQRESNSISWLLMIWSFISILIIVVEFLYLKLDRDEAKADKVETNKAFKGLEKALNKISEKK